MIGAPSNARENFSVSIVAEVMITFRSLLRRVSVFRMPSTKSMLRLRSWASSTIRVS